MAVPGRGRTLAGNGGQSPRPPPTRLPRVRVDLAKIHRQAWGREQRKEKATGGQRQTARSDQRACDLVSCASTPVMRLRHSISSTLTPNFLAAEAGSIRAFAISKSAGRGRRCAPLNQSASSYCARSYECSNRWPISDVTTRLPLLLLQLERRLEEFAVQPSDGIDPG